MDRVALIDRVLDEINRAEARFPGWPEDPLHALAILGEEFGELNKSVMQRVYEPHKDGASMEDFLDEGIQVAAMAVRFLENLRYYEWDPCEQQTRVFDAV